MAFTMPLAASNCVWNRNLSYITKCLHYRHRDIRRRDNSLRTLLLFPTRPTTAVTQFHKPSSSMQAYFVNVSIRFAVYPRTCPYLRCKVSTILPHSPIWFVDDPLWFADAAFFISKHPTSVKNNLHFRTLSAKSLHNPNKCLTFTTREPAKPLNDAQMCGSFFICTYGKQDNIQ